jgi:protein AroM
MSKKAAIICMGQSGKNEYGDICSMVSNADITITGILDGLNAEYILQNLFPKGSEAFIVSNLADGTEVRITERAAISLTSEKIIELDNQGYDAALILCTGHFEIPDVSMTVIVPERVIPGLLRAINMKNLGCIVPEPEQIQASLKQYEEFRPTIRAASPYGTIEALIDTAELFKYEKTNLIMTDCMGFTKELGEKVSYHSGKRVFVPRVILPALLNSMLC